MPLLDTTLSFTNLNSYRGQKLDNIKVLVNALIGTGHFSYASKNTIDLDNYSNDASIGSSKIWLDLVKQPGIQISLGRLSTSSDSLDMNLFNNDVSIGGLGYIQPDPYSSPIQWAPRIVYNQNYIFMFSSKYDDSNPCFSFLWDDAGNFYYQLENSVYYDINGLQLNLGLMTSRTVLFSDGDTIALPVYASTTGEFPKSQKVSNLIQIMRYDYLYPSILEADGVQYVPCHLSNARTIYFIP